MRTNKSPLNKVRRGSQKTARDPISGLGLMNQHTAGNEKAQTVDHKTLKMSKRRTWKSFPPVTTPIWKLTPQSYGDCNSLKGRKNSKITTISIFRSTC